MIVKFLRNKQKRNRLMIGAAAFAAILLLIGLWEPPLPPHLQGTMKVSGRVIECDFQRLGGFRGSSKFFVGLRLDSPGTPYFRANPKHKERDFYESLCSKRNPVTIEYRAKNRIIGPVRFWVESVHSLPAANQSFKPAPSARLN